MRQRLIIVVLALGALVATAMAAPASQQVNRRTQGPQGHAPFAVPTRDNFGTKQYNHFGDPNKGALQMDSWIYVTYDDQGLPLTNSAVSRLTKLKNVSSTCQQALLWASFITGGNDVVDSTARVCSSSQVFKVSTSNVTNIPPNSTFWCESWVEVRFEIFWTDGTHTSWSSWFSPADLWNDRCYFVG